MIFPVSVSAATLTQNQINAIISVLMAFGVDQATINAVSLALAPVAPETSIAPLYQPPQPVLDTQAPVINLNKLANYFKTNKFFSNGIYGTAGIQESNYISDTGSGVATVQWFVDGVSVAPAHDWNYGNGKFALDVTKYSNGEHTLRVTAVDKAGNSSSASITITVKNPN